MITFMDGDVDKATAMIKTAFLSLYLQGDLGAAIYYGSIVGNGQVEVGQPEIALVYCDMALKTTATTKDMGFPFWAYMGKARALVALHREPEAKPLLELAIEQARSQGAPAVEAQLLVVMGKQAAASNPEQAIAYLKAAARLSSQNGFRHPYAWSTVELANVYRDQGDLVSAQKYATDALQAMRDLEDKYHMPVHLALMADLAARRGEFRKAEAFYQQAADVVEALLINVPSREVESSLIALESQIYLGYFRLAATTHANSTKAFDILEMARGRSIADALRSEPIRRVPADATTQSARRDINRIQLTLLRETNRNKRENLLEQLFQAEQVIAPVGRPKNRLQENGVHAHPIRLATLRSSLRPDEMVLEYILDEPNSFCLRITRQTAAVTVLPAGRKQIEQSVDNYLAEIGSMKPGTDASERLYSLLLRPILGRASKPRLIIVPDGKLNLLPFDSLQDSQGRYVLNSYVVTYAPSATVLHTIRTSPVAHAPSLTLLGVGDVDYHQPRALGATAGPGQLEAATTDPFDLSGAQLVNIPKTRDEVTAVSHALGGDSRLLLGREATEAAFKSQPLADFKIIHIAAHGIVSTKFPNRSALVLGADPASREDGLLQVGEIENLTLNAQLVTLSACDTGLGKLQGEEGIANLVRAFLFAGAKSVLATLWTASDVYTPNLMGRFYRRVAEGQDEGQALRQAKLDLVTEFGDQALPVFWAGFTLVGDGSKGIPLPRLRLSALH